MPKLLALDSDYKCNHLQIVDLIDERNTEALDGEQEHIDKLDDDVSGFAVRLESLSSSDAPRPAPVTPPLDRRPLTRKLSRVQAGLNRIDGAITPTDPPIKRILLSRYQEEMADYKKDVAALFEELVAMDMDDDDELFTTHSTLERRLSTSSHKIKTLRIVPSTDSCTTDGTGVRLPKLDVPTFDANIVHWKQFWDQFTVAVYSKTNLSNAEKTVYLQHAIKDGSAKSAIEGLSHSGDNYEEAIKCIKTVQ